jgi:hypothetical protein
MVFTCRVPADPPPADAYVRMRRRTLFGAAAGGLVALGAAGCGPDKSGDKDSAPAEVTRVLAGAVVLAAAYQASAQAQPALAGKLGPLEAEHRTHISTLAAAMGRSSAPSSAATAAPSAVPPDAPGALAQLRAAEQAAQADAATACLSAPPGWAGLLGSIAACRATHVEALQ